MLKITRKCKCGGEIYKRVIQPQVFFWAHGGGVVPGEWKERNQKVETDNITYYCPNCFKEFEKSEVFTTDLEIAIEAVSSHLLRSKDNCRKICEQCEYYTGDYKNKCFLNLVSKLTNLAQAEVIQAKTLKGEN